MIFSSKILLFGEYTVLHGSDALLVPYPRHSGQLDFIKENEKHDGSKIGSNKVLQLLYNYIQNIFDCKSIDFKRFKIDIENGLFFNSTIPIGYGAGSSGALTAAVYSKYFVNKSETISDLRKQLAALESYFHGSSSGLDPLTSYLNTAIRVQGNEVNRVNINPSHFNTFIIDSGISRSTGDLVKTFNQKCQEPAYRNLITNEFKSVNNQIINDFIEGDADNLFENMKIISDLQLEHFNEMILPQYQTLWESGLKSNSFYLKLCGAGGGGYYLGFARDKNVIGELRNKFSVKWELL